MKDFIWVHWVQTSLLHHDQQNKLTMELLKRPVRVSHGINFLYFDMKYKKFSMLLKFELKINQTKIRIKLCGKIG